MFQKFLDLDQEITVYQIDLVAFFLLLLSADPGYIFSVSEEGYLRNTGNHSMLSFVFLFS